MFSVGRPNTPKLPVGVDFGATGLRLLQLDGSSRAPRVLAAAEIPCAEEMKLPGDERAARRLRAAVRAAGFTTRKCVVSPSREDVSVRTIRLPARASGEMIAQLAAHAAGAEPWAVNVQVHDRALEPGRAAAVADGGPRDLLVSAITQTAVAAGRALLETAGLRPIAVEPAFSALARFIASRGPRPVADMPVGVVVDIGWSGSSVFVMRGGRVVLARGLSIGDRDFDRAMARRLNLGEGAITAFRAGRGRAGATSDERAGELARRVALRALRPVVDELVKEITVAVRACGARCRGVGPDHVVLVGRDARAPDVGAALGERLRLPVVREAGPAFGDRGGQVTSPDGAWCVAAGLSLLGAAGRACGGVSRGEPRRAA